MPTIVLGAIFIVLSGVSLWDGYRIATTLRRPGVYDSLGPDRYLIMVGALILVLGLALVWYGWRTLRRGQPAASEELASNRHWWLLATMCAYAFLIWMLGYAPATLAFFVASLWIMGQRDWRWNLPSAIVLTVAFVLMFDYAADISFPKGVFG